MGLKKGTPGRGGRERRDSFSYCSVPHGAKGSFNGWLAGDPYWCEEAHEHTERQPGTKPCLHWMTDGQLRCPRCRVGAKLTCVGWVPLYRELDHGPVVVIVHETAADLLTGLRYPDYVLVGRAGAHDSVFVRKSDNALSFKTTNEARKRPVDITHDLLQMWRLPELEEWLRSRPQAAPAEKGGAEPVLKSDGQPFGPMHRKAAGRYAAVDAPKTADDAYDAIAARLAQTAGIPAPSKNGTKKNNA